MHLSKQLPTLKDGIEVRNALFLFFVCEKNMALRCQLLGKLSADVSNIVLAFSNES